MSDLTPKRHWDRLAEHVVQRRNELGLRQIDIPQRGGPSLDRVQAIESGIVGNYRPRTFQTLEEALGWSTGSVRAILAGGNADLVPNVAGSGSADLKHLIETAVHNAVCNCLDRGYGYTLRSRDLDAISTAVMSVVTPYLAGGAS